MSGFKTLKNNIENKGEDFNFVLQEWKGCFT